jgi:hypothetical protein
MDGCPSSQVELGTRTDPDGVMRPLAAILHAFNA